jgi:signal transduction histidine kinase
MLEAIELLGRAAAAPSARDFDLAELIREVTELASVEGMSVELAGQSPHIIQSDPSLLGIVVRNAIANAVEATRALKRRSSSNQRIVVSWGETDRDYWVGVLDWGVGLPAQSSSIFEIGTTTKQGHLGMGLALVHRSSLTLHGRVRIEPRPEGGTVFELRWPRNVKGMKP